MGNYCFSPHNCATRLWSRTLIHKEHSGYLFNLHSRASTRLNRRRYITNGLPEAM